MSKKILSLAAMVAIAAPGDRRAIAKEHTAACSQILGFVGRVRAGAQVATLHRNRGSSLGAYLTLRVTARSMVKEGSGATCGAFGPTLRDALERAASSPTALDASLEIDRGFDSALSLVALGRLPSNRGPAKLPPIGESALYGENCPDLFPLVLQLEGPEAPGEPASAGAGVESRVAAVLADLQARPRCAAVRALLESTPKARLGHAVESIKLDEPDSVPAEAPLHVRCPELPIIVERLNAAIEVGVPTYNRGDHEGCRRIYETAARAILKEVVSPGHCPSARQGLEAGIVRASSRSTPNEAAWALRHSFDAIVSDYQP